MFNLQFGSFMVRNLSDYIPQMFEPHIATFVNYFITTLNNTEDCNSPVVYDTIMSMNNILEISVQAPQVCELIKIAETIIYYIYEINILGNAIVFTSCSSCARNYNCSVNK